MRRRDFLKKGLAAGSVTTMATLTGTSAAAEWYKKNDRQYYELREYSFTRAEQLEMVENYYRDAAIPALNRLGSKTIGVFREHAPAGLSSLFVLIPFASPDKFVALRGALLKDNTYQSAARAYLDVQARQPAYTRIQSSFFRAFDKIPFLVVPSGNKQLFELRRYESHSELAGQKKIHMFNVAGEIDIFRRVGLEPVFFGEALIGSKLPNLTYMLVFDDMAAHDDNWKAFGNDAQWKQIKDLPQYADTVSHIERTFLVPAKCSQIGQGTI